MIRSIFNYLYVPVVFVRSFQPKNVVFVWFGVVVFVRGKLSGITGFVEIPHAALSGPRARVHGWGWQKGGPAACAASWGHPRARIAVASRRVKALGHTPGNRRELRFVN